MTLKEVSFTDAIRFSKELKRKSYFANPFYLYHDCLYEEKNGEILLYEKTKIDNQYPLIFLPNNSENFTNQIISTGFDEDISIIEKTHHLKTKEILGYEYFYSTDEWINLQGAKFRDVRKQINKFQKEHHFKILNNYPKEKILKFLTNWATEKRKKEVTKLMLAITTILRILQRW